VPVVNFRDLPEHERRALRSADPHPLDDVDEPEPDGGLTRDDLAAEGDRAADRYERALRGDS
jgi:hypothetical protein